MKLSNLSTVSALALMLAVGAPAQAQVTQPADEPAVGTTQPADEPTADVTTPPAGTAETPTADTPAADAPSTEAPAEEPQVAQDHGTDELSVAELEELLGEIGVEDSELFAGQAVVTRTDGDQPVIMLIGPEDFERGEIAEFDIESFGELRDQMSNAGFDEAREDDQWQVLQGTLDGHSVFATSGDPRWGDETAGVAERALGEPADFDRDQFEEKLGEAGIEDRAEFQGKLVFARTEEGKTVKLLIGPEGFAGDDEIDLSDDELREKLEEAGLTNVQVMEDRVGMFRGSYGDHSVLVLGGEGITERQMSMEAAGSGEDTDITDVDRAD